MAALPTGAKASLIGDEVTLVSQFGPCNPCSDTVTVGDPGIEFTASGGSGVGAVLALVPTQPSFIDIGPSSITFEIPGIQFTSNFSLLDMDWLPDPGTITSISLGAGSTQPNNTGGLAGLSATITNAADGSSVNFNLNCTVPISGCSGGTFIIDFNTVHAPVAVVPLPAALPLFLSALAGLGFVGWRRRQADG